MRTFYEAAKPLYPLTALFLISTTWAYLSPNNILAWDPRIFFMVTGTIFSNFSVSFKLNLTSSCILYCHNITFPLSECSNFNLKLFQLFLVPSYCRTDEQHNLRWMELPALSVFAHNFNLHCSISAGRPSRALLRSGKMDSHIVAKLFQCFTFPLRVWDRH